MKKRILSFLMACFMVASTFIISKPLVHVHAVDSETTYEEDVNQWTLPYNWHTDLDTYTDSDGNTWDLASKKDGIWRLTSYNTETGALTWDGTKGKSYVESWHNRNELSYVPNKNTLDTNWSSWYMSTNHRWNGGSLFGKGDNSSWLKVSMATVEDPVKRVDANGEYILSNGSQIEAGLPDVGINSKNPAVVFTAPANGLYSYSELVTANNLLDDSNWIDGSKTAQDVVINVNVRKNGEVINSFILDKNTTSKTLEGTVTLIQGDMLMFVFSLENDVMLGKNSTAETSNYILKLSDVVVKKVSDSIAVGTTFDLPTDFYTCNPDAGEKINGNWQLAAYNTATKTIGYKFGAAGTSHTATSWYFDSVAPTGGQCGTFAYNSRGFETNPGSDTYPSTASVIIFTAPDDGVYEFDVDTFSYGTNATKTGSRTVIFYVMKDGVIYDITNPKYNADNTEKMTGTITLKKGEQIYFCAQRYTRYTRADSTQDWPAWIGARYEALSVEKVAELTEGYDYVTKYTFAPDGTALADGQFEMKAYDFTTKTVSDAALTTGDSWYVSATSGNKLFWKTGTANAVAGWGPDGSATNANEGAAIVFTAPVTGTYNITGHFNKTYVKNEGSLNYCDYKIILEDGTVVFDGTNYDESTAATFNNLSHTLGGSVELQKGEKIYIVKSPNASAVTGSQGGTLYSLTVAQIGDVCEGEHTFVDGVCTVCDYECANHAWKNAAGTCTVCEVAHTHTAVDSDATCTDAAICGTCGYEVAGINAEAHAPATEWTTDEAGHWYACNNGCEEKLSYAEHDYATGTCVCGKACPHATYVDGKCADCGTDCPAHDMKNAEGACATCGMTHTHDVDATDATCVAAAVCGTCGYEVAPKNPENHIGDMSVVEGGNGDGTHNWVCNEEGCGAVVALNEPCTYENNVCVKCGYDCTVDVAEDNFGEVFESVFTEGATTDHVAQGPASLDDLDAAIEGDKVTGFTYRGFNLEMISATSKVVKLRHHILLDGKVENYTVLVDDEAVTLTNVSGNYYYFEVEVEVGQFGAAHEVTVNGTTVVTASVHSYMRTAFEADEKNPDALTDEQENLLNALYDWDKAVADANANA